MTPDGRYIVVRGRLWRATNPTLEPEERQRHVDALQAARRAVKAAKKAERDGKPYVTAMKTARSQVQAAKEALGERGPVWWTDGSPDLNRRLAKNTPYADWWAEHEGQVTQQ